MSSPRNFWHGKVASPSPFNENAYDRPESPSVARRRASIENLKKVSRVKNSAIFAKEQASEYDPSSPTAAERPLAGGRPLANAIQTNNSFVGLNSLNSVSNLDDAVRRDNNPARGHRRGESHSQIPVMQLAAERAEQTPSPSSRASSRPPKSSLVNRGASTLPRHYDRSSIQLSDDEDGPKVSPPRQLRRQAKIGHV